MYKYSHHVLQLQYDIFFLKNGPKNLCCGSNNENVVNITIPFYGSSDIVSCAHSFSFLSFGFVHRRNWSLGSSVSIMTTDWVTGVRSPAEDFSSSVCVQTSSEAHPASYPVGTRGPFPGG
jgi:hypothetical protein